MKGRRWRRGDHPVLWLTNEHLHQLEAYAAEVFPHEAFGLLLGYRFDDHLRVTGIYTYQAARRFRQTVIIDDEPEARVDDILGDLVVADWHSHPNMPVTPSRMREYSKREDKESTDEFSMIQPEYPGSSLIISIYPKKDGWSTKFAHYYYSNRIRRGKIGMHYASYI